MKILILIIGILIGAAAVWYYRSHPEDKTVQDAGRKIESTTREAGSGIREKLRSLDLDSDRIRDELARSGQVIRRNATNATAAIADATADARITAAIKAKFLKDPDLSVWNISVNTTAGTVTLSGTVENPDHVGKAMMLAMETEGVRQVISTLQLKAAKQP